MTTSARRGTRDRLVAAPREDLCLDFANTRYRRGTAQPTETLQNFADLVAWCETAGALDRAGAAELLAWGARHQGQAAALLGEAIAAREAIYGLFAATASGHDAADADIAALNRLLEDTAGRQSVVVAPAGNMWRLPPAAPQIASLHAPVLWSSGDLLVGRHLHKVRLCANEKCEWMFLDDSKSGTRRWCAMRSCGNRAKAHRHYMRKTKPERAAAVDPAKAE